MFKVNSVPGPLIASVVKLSGRQMPSKRHLSRLNKITCFPLISPAPVINFVCFQRCCAFAKWFEETSGEIKLRAKCVMTSVNFGKVFCSFTCCIGKLRDVFKINIGQNRHQSHIKLMASFLLLDFPCSQNK